MKKLIVYLAAIAMLAATTGCANGPVRNFLRNAICNTGCEAPPADPSFGFNNHANGGCATGDCQGGHSIPGGQLIQPQGTSYMNDGYIQNDPYMSGSNINGATINPPVFDNYSGPSYGSTIVPPASSGTLPGPSSGQ